MPVTPLRMSISSGEKSPASPFKRSFRSTGLNFRNSWISCRTAWRRTGRRFIEGRIHILKPLSLLRGSCCSRLRRCFHLLAAFRSELRQSALPILGRHLQEALHGGRRQRHHLLLLRLLLLELLLPDRLLPQNILLRRILRGLAASGTARAATAAIVNKNRMRYLSIGVSKYKSSTACATCSISALLACLAASWRVRNVHEQHQRHHRGRNRDHWSDANATTTTTTRISAPLPPRSARTAARRIPE